MVGAYFWRREVSATDGCGGWRGDARCNGGSPPMGGGGIVNGDGATVPKQETMETVEPGSTTGIMEDEE